MRPTTLLFVATMLSSSWVMQQAVAQGSLTPSGPPAQTMRTLTQIEPRTPITAVPFVINSSGSYYLTGSLQALAGQNGIRVNADNVSIDLGGFSLIGNGGGTGVVVTASVKNFSIANGVIRGWAQHGVNLSGASNSQVERLRLSDNGSDGIIIGSTTVIRDCVAAGNTGSGIRVVGADSRVENNHCTGNQVNGFRVDAAGNLIVKNSAAGNAGGDYSIAAGSSYGQILNVPGANFANDVPWANFGTSCPQGQTLCSGACVSTNSSITSCGACGIICSTNNLNPVCTSGVCSGTCSAGFSDCNGNKQTDGCETATGSDTQNCGSCGNLCPTRANAVIQCQSGSCVFYCLNGFADCNNSPADGCETGTMADSQNCGNCGNVCPNGPNFTSLCTGGGCLYNCSSGYGNCNGSWGDGCEIDLSVNVSNCGACGNVCNDGLACTTDTCTGGACTASINPGSCVIGGQCYANGAPNPGNACQACNASLNQTGWSQAANGTVCAPSQCTGSTLTVFACNSGVCSGAQSSCAPYNCNGSACGTTCASDANCVSTAYCSGSACFSKKSNGLTCSGNNQCQSGFCVDGVCCNSACNGVCFACTAAKKGSGVDGSCGPIASGLDPDNECTGGLGVCNGSGACN